MLKSLRLGCKPSEKQIYTDALRLFETTKLDFVDVLTIARMWHEGVQTVISFDTDFDQFPSITRQEPQLTEPQAQAVPSSPTEQELKQIAAEERANATAKEG